MARNTSGGYKVQDITANRVLDYVDDWTKLTGDGVTKITGHIVSTTAARDSSGAPRARTLDDYLVSEGAPESPIYQNVYATMMLMLHDKKKDGTIEGATDVDTIPKAVVLARESASPPISYPSYVRQNVAVHIPDEWVNMRVRLAKD